MLPYLQSNFGNPSSSHVYGRISKEAVEKSREQVAALIGADIDEIIFTSGGILPSDTFARNAALRALRVLPLAFHPQNIQAKLKEIRLAPH